MMSEVLTEKVMNFTNLAYFQCGPPTAARIAGDFFDSFRSSIETYINPKGQKDCDK